MSADVWWRRGLLAPHWASDATLGPCPHLFAHIRLPLLQLQQLLLRLWELLPQCLQSMAACRGHLQCVCVCVWGGGWQPAVRGPLHVGGGGLRANVQLAKNWTPQRQLSTLEHRLAVPARVKCVCVCVCVCVCCVCQVGSSVCVGGDKWRGMCQVGSSG